MRQQCKTMKYCYICIGIVQFIVLINFCLSQVSKQEHQNETINNNSRYNNKEKSIDSEPKLTRRTIVSKTEFAIKKQKWEPDCMLKLYYRVSQVVTYILKKPKIHSVLSNIGTCIVNGGLEIVSHYLPPAAIPLIASAAGMLIPFEPVVTLRERIPIESYRRAMSKAVNSFLGTFDKYKVQEDFVEDDPYMKRRFNRRFMNIRSDEEDDSKKSKKRE